MSLNCTRKMIKMVNVMLYVVHQDFLKNVGKTMGRLYSWGGLKNGAWRHLARTECRPGWARHHHQLWPLAPATAHPDSQRGCSCHLPCQDVPASSQNSDLKGRSLGPVPMAWMQRALGNQVHVICINFHPGKRFLAHRGGVGAVPIDILETWPFSLSPPSAACPGPTLPASSPAASCPSWSTAPLQAP